MSEIFPLTIINRTDESSMGDFELATSILKCVAQHKRVFRPVQPTDKTSAESNHIKEYMFIVFVKNDSTDETARLEVRLNLENRLVCGKSELSYHIGTITRFGSAKSETRIDVSTIFFDQ